MHLTYIVELGLEEMETTAPQNPLKESWNPNVGTSSLTVQSQSNPTWDFNATGMGTAAVAAVTVASPVTAVISPPTPLPAVETRTLLFQNQNQVVFNHFYNPDNAYLHNVSYTDSPPEIFADLVNLGWDMNAESPWDLFNIDAMMGAQPVMGLDGGSTSGEGVGGGKEGNNLDFFCLLKEYMLLDLGDHTYKNEEAIRQLWLKPPAPSCSTSYVFNSCKLILKLIEFKLTLRGLDVDSLLEWKAVGERQRFVPSNNVKKDGRLVELERLKEHARKTGGIIDSIHVDGVAEYNDDE
ncbi:hypothetical protein K435DRAFT_810301 [Dendrothele bispora CBS 962.96]|uniref:Uncharacterized protein n=1 Tax=Dendrothele bispora (strain CBS 962.96) TaxID=1314807 RepID=A0A4S8KWK0_DENBC|nr:hypothetical protein K435DRAFT_810301 [Dendrothele bispora CBS 962.96]